MSKHTDTKQHIAKSLVLLKGTASAVPSMVNLQYGFSR